MKNIAATVVVNSYKNKISELEAENALLLKTFRHTHVNNQKNDGCKKCGLDLRHPIHTRFTE